MAKASGVGGLGWLVLGVAIGAAVVLAVQTFAHKSESAASDAPSSSRMLTIAPTAPAAPPPPVAVQAAPAPKVQTPIETPAPSAAPSSTSAAAVASQDAAQVADDAASVGMTSRSVN